MKKYTYIFAIFVITVIFFYKSFFLFQIPFPGDLLVSEYAPWKYESYLGYNPGSYPNKAQYFDVIRQLYPWKMLVVEELKEGRIPLWNPYSFAGTPLLANNQSAVFNPFNILFFILQPAIAWSLFIILQPFLASLFTYLYLKHLKLSPYASILGAISYGFSLYMATFLEYGNFGHTIMWLPLGLLIVEKIVQEKRKMYSLLLPIIVSLVIFSGHLQLAFGVIAFLVLYIITQTKHKIKLIFLTIIGIGISGVQLLPTLELIKNSARASHDIANLSTNFLLQFHQLILYIAPDIYGNPATRNYLLADAYPGNSVYMGVATLFFALFGAFSKSKKVFFFGITFLGILVFLTNNPLSYLFYSLNIPLLSTSSPANFIFLMSFCVATLAAYGVDVWQQNKIKKQFMLIGVGFIFFSLLSIVHFLFHLPYIQKQLILGGTVFAVVAACLIAGKWINKKIIFLAILILTVGELFYYFHKFNPFVPKDLMFPSTQIESVLKQTLGVDRFIGYGPASIESNYSILFRLLSPDGYDPLYPRTYHEYTKSTSRSDVKLALKDAKQLDELGIKYILNRKESGADEKVLPPEKYSLTLEKNGWTVYENKNALPRAYIISGKERTPALIRKYEPGRIEIENPQIKGTLILSDNFYPGWNVIIDGSKGTTLKINEIFLGVEVKETDKSILFQYKPQSFYIGLALTIISLGVVIVFLVYSKKLWR